MLEYSDVIEKLNSNTPFAFSRWGDGEFAIVKGEGRIYNIIINREGPIISKYTYVLEDILERTPNYYIGIQPLAKSTFPNLVENYTRHLKTFNADILHHASISKNLQLFIDALLTKEVIIVGPKYLSKLPFYFEHIVTPLKKVWNYDREILHRLKSKDLTNKVVLYSSSVVSNFLIDQLHKNGTHIDTGSVFDPYCGVIARSYHSSIKHNLYGNRSI